MFSSVRRSCLDPLLLEFLYFFKISAKLLLLFLQTLQPPALQQLLQELTISVQWSRDEDAPVIYLYIMTFIQLLCTHTDLYIHTSSMQCGKWAIPLNTPFNTNESFWRNLHSEYLTVIRTTTMFSPAVFPLELDEIWTSVGGTIVLVCSALVLTTRYLLQTHCWQHKMHHSPAWQKISHPKRPRRRWVFISGDVAACVKRPAFESPSYCNECQPAKRSRNRFIYVNVWRIFLL